MSLVECGRELRVEGATGDGVHPGMLPCGGVSTPAPGTPSPLRYRVRVLGAEQALDVLLVIDDPAADLIIGTPTWVPGAYAFLKYGRDVFDVRASRGRLTRHGFAAYHIASEPDGRTPLEISCRASAADPAWGELAGIVRHDHAVLLATRYLRPDGDDRPCRVTYEIPAGWSLHHPAGARRIDDHTWEYPSFAALMDSPVVAGTFEVHTRTLHGVQFHHVFLDRAVGFDTEIGTFMDDLGKIAEQTHAIFGSFPFENYTYVFTFDPTAHWGLEHASATMIALGENALIDPEARADALRVAAHELFHAWNVCRLKPSPLGRADLSSGSFPDTLWVAEGFTRYYEFLLLVRAGVYTPEELLSNLVNYYRQLTAMPAYRRVTAVDSSRATFLNHNRYPGSVNGTVDYYDLGMLIAFDLDVALQQAGSALDREFARFYATFVDHADGFTQADLRSFFGAIHPAFAELIAREAERAGGLRAPESFGQLGFEVTTAQLPRAGIVLEKGEGPAIADGAYESPAARAGLAPGDVLMTVGGFPFHKKSFAWLVAHRESLAIEVRRGHRFHAFTIRPELRSDITGLRWIGDTTQAERLRSWLGIARAPAFTQAEGAAIPLTSYRNFHGIQTIL